MKPGVDDWIAVAFGGGTNSTAMLCGFLERGIKPGFIAFADTGSEKPHTYEHVEDMKVKVREWWGLDLLIVRQLFRGEFEGLGGECERRSQMPSLAYGGKNRKACSVKYKVQPQSRAIKIAMRAAGVSVALRAIGYGVDERYRASMKPTSEQFNKKLSAVNYYPLIDWEWSRAACVLAIARHGIKQPGKSACYFCPSSKKSEVLALRNDHPLLFQKALAIEDSAQPALRQEIGLGGPGNRWRDWAKRDDDQGKLTLDIEPVHIPCDCMD